MDYSAPVSKRTRLREALFYKQLHKRFKEDQAEKNDNCRSEQGADASDFNGLYEDNGGEEDSVIECYESEKEEEVVVIDEVDFVDSVGSTSSKKVHKYVDGELCENPDELCEDREDVVTIKIEDSDEEIAEVAYDSVQSSCSIFGNQANIDPARTDKPVSSAREEAEDSVSRKNDEVDQTECSIRSTVSDIEEKEEEEKGEDDEEEEGESDDDYHINISSSSSEELCSYDSEEMNEFAEKNSSKEERVKDVKLSAFNSTSRKQSKDGEYDHCGGIQGTPCRLKQQSVSIATRTRSHWSVSFGRSAGTVQTSAPLVRIDVGQDYPPLKSCTKKKTHKDDSPQKSSGKNKSVEEGNHPHNCFKNSICCEDHPPQMSFRKNKSHEDPSWNGCSKSGNEIYDHPQNNYRKNKSSQEGDPPQKSSRNKFGKEDNLPQKSWRKKMTHEIFSLQNSCGKNRSDENVPPQKRWRKNKTHGNVPPLNNWRKNNFHDHHGQKKDSNAMNTENKKRRKLEQDLKTMREKVCKNSKAVDHNYGEKTVDRTIEQKSKKLQKKSSSEQEEYCKNNKANDHGNLGNDQEAKSGTRNEFNVLKAPREEHIIQQKSEKLQKDFNDERDEGGGNNQADDLDNPTKVQKAGMRTPKDFNILKVLLASISNKEEAVADPKTKPPKPEASLPQKFFFGETKPVPAEKTQYEKELDELWSEFDFSLRSSEIGASTVDLDPQHCHQPFVSSSILCSEGNHDLVLDEEIGVRCKNCSLVVQEIKHILPSFYKNPWGRHGSKDMTRDSSILNKLFEDTHPPGHDHDPSVLEKDTVWDIIPGIHSTMYPHQREGFEFIWKNIAGGTSLSKIEECSATMEEASGCIISHAPGTGKTRLTIVFLQTYMKMFPKRRPMIIAPCSMLLTWEEELQKWSRDIPYHNLHSHELSGKENLLAVNFLLQSKQTKKSIRLVKLYSWKRDTSILLLSYGLFVKLAGEEGKCHRNSEEDEEQVRKILLELPDILVLDEGHTPRNDQSLIWKALTKIETQKRIILSGTPFQNNFGELYNTLCLVTPKFADRFGSFAFGRWQENSIKKRGRKCKSLKGTWASLTKSIQKDDTLKELKGMLSPFVHVHSGKILKDSLPGLRDCIVVLIPTPLQRSLLEKLEDVPNKLELSHLVSLTSVHPSLSKGDNLDDLRLKHEAGVKTHFVIELIRLSESLNEKVLIFSQYIDTLTCIGEQLRSLFNWAHGKEILYMDGAVNTKQRQSSITSFNEADSEVRVLLASIRACSEGINLVGASRVVLLDVVWNPSVERQAISRAYRLGQRNVVYIYRLITLGTMEGEKYCRQAEKDRLSELVFSSAVSDFETLRVSSSVCEDRILDEMVRHEKLKFIFEKIIYQPKETNLIESFGLVDS